MARQDRLYEIIQILRQGELVKAEDLAQQFNVSLRTIYRDMDTLITSGVPVRGERGVGYQITAAYTLPALNLSKTELEALHVGLATVAQVNDKELAEAAKSLSARIDGVLPEDKPKARGWSFATYPFAATARGFHHMPALRSAIRAKQKMQISIFDDVRIIRPLALDFWGRLWTVSLWCETQDQFEVFRLDQIQEAKVLPVLFVDERGKSLEDLPKRGA